MLKPENACSSREKSSCDCPLRSILSGDARRVALTSFEGIQSTKPDYWKLYLAVCQNLSSNFLLSESGKARKRRHTACLGCRCCAPGITADVTGLAGCKVGFLDAAALFQIEEKYTCAFGMDIWTLIDPRILPI